MRDVGNILPSILERTAVTFVLFYVQDGTRASLYVHEKTWDRVG